MKRSGKSQDIAATKSKDATLPQKELRIDAFELEKLLKQFAYQPVYFSQRDEETGKAKARLEDLLKARWGTCDRDVVQKGHALIEWVLLCPPLLKGQPGFEWVQENFIKLFLRRLHYWDLGQKAVRDLNGRLSGVDDQQFWKIVQNVRGKLNRGHPQTLVKDYERANLVFNLTMLHDSATAQPMELHEAAKIVARYEVLQRIIAVDRFLGEAADISKSDAKRLASSWGIAQRKGAMEFLKEARKCSSEHAERLIDEWNLKQKVKRAKMFLIEKRKYSEKQAEGQVAQWKLDESLGKENAIRFLTRELGYNDSQAGKIVNRWGTTGKVENVDPSPIYASLRKVKAQGHWYQLRDIGHTDKDYAQEVVHIVSKTMSGTSEHLKDDGANQSTKTKGHRVKVLSTKALLEMIQGGPKSQAQKTHARKTKKRRKQ